MNFICGINPVLEALAAGNRHFDRLLVVKGLRNQRITEAIARANRLGIALRFEPREALDRLANGVPHQGLMAVVSQKALLGLEQVLAGAREPALMVVLDGIEDPRNLGAILRTVEAAGADGVVLSERNSAGLSETVNRASAGALEHVKVARGGNLVQTLEAMKARGIWVVGLDASGTERWDKVDCTRPLAIVVGGEGKGIRRLVREHCDHLVALPMFGHVGSLNVSVAAGIALYEVVRQRGLVPSHVRPIPAKLAQHGPSQIEGPAADDAEDDPGASIGARVAAEGNEPDDDHLAEPEPSMVEIHEEAAWAGPTVLKPVGFSRRSGAAAVGARPRRRRPPFGKGRSKDGRRDGRDGREGREPRDGRGEAPPRQEGAADGASVPGSDGRPDSRPGPADGARRRRGKRRGRRGGAPAPGGAPGPPESSGGGGEGSPPTATPGAGGAPSGAPGAGKGRRRRRRRRH